MEGMGIMNLFSDIYRNKSVFLTGVTGFKGSWMAHWLINLGAKVTGYALTPPTEPNHFDLLKPDINMIYGDIRDDEKLKGSIRAYKPDIIFHLAAQPLVRLSYSNPKETFETNVIGTLNLFEACRNIESIKAVVNITTDKCYENKEWIWPYRENDPMGGFDPYSASKGCSELLSSCYRNSFFNLSDYGSKHNTLIATCRAGNVIGGGDWAKDRIVPDIIRAAVDCVPVEIRNPKAVRPWQHVLEPIAGYLMVGEKLLKGEKACADAWNFGPDENDNREVGDIVSLMHKNWNKIEYNVCQSPDNLHEAHFLRLDSSKAKIMLGWKPVWDFHQAVDNTLKWYKSFYEEKNLITLEQLNAYIKDLSKLNIG